MNKIKNVRYVFQSTVPKKLKKISSIKTFMWNFFIGNTELLQLTYFCVTLICLGFTSGAVTVCATCFFFFDKNVFLLSEATARSSSSASLLTFLLIVCLILWPSSYLCFFDGIGHAAAEDTREYKINEFVWVVKNWDEIGLESWNCNFWWFICNLSTSP